MAGRKSARLTQHDDAEGAAPSATDAGAARARLGDEGVHVVHPALAHERDENRHVLRVDLGRPRGQLRA